MTVVRVFIFALLLANCVAISAQEMSPIPPTPLSKLLAEATASNSQIAVARHRWLAAKAVPRQVTTLPDPTFTYQQLSVGSPRPFAGYTNSDFAYIGLGASQALPYPGKLRLRGEVAQRDADVMGSERDAAQSQVCDAVKADYIELAYLQKTIGILVENQQILDQMIQDAAAHYAVGKGSQVDILQAQIERTKMVREITMHHLEVGKIEADLKGLLHRDQDSPEIITEDLIESPLPPTSADLLQQVRTKNPQIQIDASSIRKQDAAVVSAKREGRPDFDLAYMYQNTDRKYRDYYMFTLNVSLPRKKRVDAEIAEAQQKVVQSRAELDAHLQAQLTAVQQAYVTAAGDRELLKEYGEGLIPQSEAAYRSTMNDYASNRGQFSQVLLGFINVLSLKLDSMQTLAEYETALAHLETLTGATLR